MIVREATLEDGLAVLAELREQQCVTLRKLQLDPEALLREAMASGPALAGFIDGRCAGVLGVSSSTLLGLAKIWMITTPAVEREPVAFLRASRRFLRVLHAQHGILIGMVDCDFEKSRRWLEWLGFRAVSSGEVIMMRYSGGH